jgi:hypothetical protein
VDRLLKLQEVADWRARLDAATQPEARIDLKALEDAFAEVALEYATRNDITWTTWRAAGVPTAVLKRAGIART